MNNPTSLFKCLQEVATQPGKKKKVSQVMTVMMNNVVKDSSEELLHRILMTACAIKIGRLKGNIE